VVATNTPTSHSGSHLFLTNKQTTQIHTPLTDAHWSSSLPHKQANSTTNATTVTSTNSTSTKSLRLKIMRLKHCSREKCSRDLETYEWHCELSQSSYSHVYNTHRHTAWSTHLHTTHLVTAM